MVDIALDLKAEREAEAQRKLAPASTRTMEPVM